MIEFSRSLFHINFDHNRRETKNDYGKKVRILFVNWRSAGATTIREIKIKIKRGNQFLRYEKIR